jgi:nucleotide-binding universal stress UspA family protein
MRDIMKVLLAIDSSKSSETVIAEMLVRLWPPATEVLVLTVIDTFAFVSAVGDLKPLIRNENEAARGLVESVAERLKSQGFAATGKAVEGYPASSIVEEAQTLNADFIVLGSHGHGGLERFLIGSVAKEVLRNAQCSVEIVRPVEPGKEKGAGEPARIMLATDGSEYSRAAARSIAERPWKKGTEIRILSVLDPFIPAIEPWYGAAHLIEQTLKQRESECEEAVKSAGKLLADAGLAVTTMVKEGGPKWRIIEQAQEWQADLLVMGSHGRRGLKRLLLGSVSEVVALHARCSVEVIRSPALLNARERDAA